MILKEIQQVYKTKEFIRYEPYMYMYLLVLLLRQVT